MIRGFSCPLVAVVPRDPEACRLAEVLLSEVIGATVRERCGRGNPPHCCFEVLPGGDGDLPHRAPETERRPEAPCDAEGQAELLGGDPPCWQHLFEDEDYAGGR